METLSPLLPREKMLRDGATRLTDEELLALFLRTGTRSKNVFALARDLLQHFGSLHGLLSAELKDFRRVEGIGLATFAQLKGIAGACPPLLLLGDSEHQSAKRPADDPGVCAQPTGGRGARDLYGHLPR